MAEYSEFNNKHFSSSTTISIGAIFSMAVMSILLIATNWSLFIIIPLGLICFFAPLRTVPFKHYGVATFGEPLPNWVFDEGTHWILPFWGLKTECYDHMTYSEEIAKILSYNNILLDIKVTITYGLANIHQWIYTKQEAVGILRSGILKALNESIRTNKYTETEIIHKKKNLERDIYNELKYIFAEKGIGIWTYTIEWIKPSDIKIMETYINDVTYDNQIKRVFGVAKDFNLNAEEAFRIEAIRTRLINSNENVYRLAGSKEIIEAVTVLLRNLK